MSALLERHRRAILLAVVLLTLGGVVAALRLPVGLFPVIDYPRIVVSIDAGERDAGAMAAAITRPMEIALRAVPGVTHIRSTTSRGSAEIALSFDWGQDMVTSLLGVQGRLATLQAELPPGTRFEVRRSDPTIFPVYGLALTSQTRDPRALRELAELRLRPLLSSVPGVAGIDILGGSPREIAVIVDPARLRALSLTLADVAQALNAANTIQAVGRLEDRHRLYLALVEDRVASIADIAATPIKTGASAAAGLVTLGQIATIEPSIAPSYTRVTSNGGDAVLVNIRQSPLADSLRLTAAIDARLAGAKLPPGIRITPFYDQSELVRGAAEAVRDAILLGALLAGIVLFVFLRSWRLMLLTGLMLPAVLAATCLLLGVFGMSFNMMTLGGLAAAVGLIVDDAVVMLEHMVRRLQEGVATTTRALLAAGDEMGGPLLGSTLATVVVFLPLAFISGVTGGFFKALALTMTAALTFSLIYARGVLPLAAAHWLTAKDATAAARADALSGRIERGYARAVAPALARPGLTLALLVVLLAGAGWLGYARVDSGFMPKMDEGGFILDYKAKPGAALSDTDRLLRQAEAIITATPEVASYSRRTGLQLGGGLSEADEGDFFIRLKGGSRRDIDAVMSEVRTRITAQVPGLDIETAQLMEDLIGDLTAVPQPIEVKLFGDVPDELSRAARTTAAVIGKVSGVVEVRDGQRVAGDAVAITVDRPAAAQTGLDPDAVARQIEAQVGGTVATQIRSRELLINVRVRAPLALRDRVQDLGALLLRSADGRPVALRQVARIAIVAGQKQLTREDLAPFAAVTARLDGRDLGSAMVDVKRAVAAAGLPASVRVEYGGLYEQQQRSFTDLATVFVAALMLVALLLTILFGRWRYTVAAIATVLLAAGAVLAGLWATGTELDISALMGLTMAVGMITELVIFFLAELDPAVADSAESVLAAARARLRPILMSALIAILTLSPLALGVARGAGLQRPLATAIIFGLAAGAPLVLFFLPAALVVGRRRQ